MEKNIEQLTFELKNKQDELDKIIENTTNLFVFNPKIQQLIEDINVIKKEIAEKEE